MTWKQVKPGTFGNVTVRADGTVKIPRTIAERVLSPEKDRAAVYHGPEGKIAIRAGGDPDTTFGVTEYGNRVQISCASAVKCAIGKTPDESQEITYRIKDEEIGLSLVLDLSEVLQ